MVPGRLGRQGREENQREADEAFYGDEVGEEEEEFHEERDLMAYDSTNFAPHERAGLGQLGDVSMGGVRCITFTTWAFEPTRVHFLDGWKMIDELRSFGCLLLDHEILHDVIDRMCDE